MKKKPLRVALDIDNVSSPMAERVIDAINEKYGSNLTTEDIREWYQKWKHNGKTTDYSKELFELFDKPGFLEGAPVMPGAQEGIKTLLDRGDEVSFLTGRHPRLKEATQNWARQIDPDLNITYAPTGKGPHVNNFDVLLDDSPKEIYDWGIKGGNPVVYDKPWNRNVKNISARRVADWPEFTDSIKHD